MECAVYHVWEDEFETLSVYVRNGIGAYSTKRWLNGDMLYFEIPKNKEPWLHRSLERMKCWF